MGSLQVFLHLLLFAFISVVIFFIVPPTYKTFIIDSFIKKYPGNGPEVYAGVYGFDLFVIVLLHIVIFFHDRSRFEFAYVFPYRNNLTCYIYDDNICNHVCKRK